MNKLFLSIAFFALSITTINAQQLVKSHKFTFDNELRPILTVSLHNKLPKQITHIVYSFTFFDSAGWTDDSVTRALAEKQSTSVTRQVNLKPNYTMKDSFIIPQLNYGDNAEPKGMKIIMVRYSDGTVNKDVKR